MIHATAQSFQAERCFVYLYTEPMRWNPFLNASIASGYIAGIALFLQFIQSFKHNTPDTPIDAVGALSLLVFSVALMGFLFFYRPAVLLLDNKREEAVSYFLKTLGTFGVITALVFIALSLI